MSEAESFFILFATGAIPAVDLPRHHRDRASDRSAHAEVARDRIPAAARRSHHARPRGAGRAPVVTAVIMQLAAQRTRSACSPRAASTVPSRSRRCPGTGLRPTIISSCRRCDPQTHEQRPDPRGIWRPCTRSASASRASRTHPTSPSCAAAGPSVGFQRRSVAEHSTARALARRQPASRAALRQRAPLPAVAAVPRLDHRGPAVRARRRLQRRHLGRARRASSALRRCSGCSTLAPPPIMSFTPEGHALRVRLSGSARLHAPRRAGPHADAAITAGRAAHPGRRPHAGRSSPRPAPRAHRRRPRRAVGARPLRTHRAPLPYAILFRQEREWQRELEHLGGTVEFSQNMRVLGSTLEGLMAILQVLSAIGQVLRAIGAVFSLVGRADCIRRATQASAGSPSRRPSRNHDVIAVLGEDPVAGGAPVEASPDPRDRVRRQPRVGRGSSPSVWNASSRSPRWAASGTPSTSAAR